jgi:hypothetical protein
MPSLIANVNADIESVVDVLLTAGLQWRHPTTQAVYYWTEEDQVIAASEFAAMEAGRAGCLIQLWRDNGDDLSLEQSDGGVCLFFDGCSARDVATYLTPLINRGIKYWVGPAD